MDDPAEIAAADAPRRACARETSGPVARRAGRLVGKVALITGGDSRIGRAAAVRFAREGADVAFTHLARHADARRLARAVEREGAGCLALCGDVDDPGFCEALVAAVVGRFGGVDVLVNNLVARGGAPSFFPLFFLTRRLLPHLRDRTGSSILNTVDADDAGSLRAALDGCTRSLAASLAPAGIRVRAVVSGGDLDDDVGAARLVYLACDAAAGPHAELIDLRAP